MTEAAYKEWVLQEYDRKLKEDRLPLALVTPTPGGLKGVAADACLHRFMPRDEVLLQTFFKQKESPAAYRAAILTDDASVFKPLSNFLRDRSIHTQFKNIQLLAWLIEFEPRPFQPGLVRKQPDDTPVVLNEGGPAAADQKRTQQDVAGEPDRISVMSGSKKIWVFVLVLGLIVVTAYFLARQDTPKLTGQERCMIWDNDHYQPVDCAEKFVPGPVYPINRQLVDHFKKILQPDTLTPHSIGKVWYSKYNGRVEFFTAQGYYPLDSNRRLLPMTDHILEKYVYHIRN